MTSHCPVCGRDGEAVAALERTVRFARKLFEENEKMREAIEAMASSGWLYFGPEGPSDAQSLVISVIEYISRPAVRDDVRDES